MLRTLLIATFVTCAAFVPASAKAQQICGDRAKDTNQGATQGPQSKNGGHGNQRGNQAILDGGGAGLVLEKREEALDDHRVVLQSE